MTDTETPDTGIKAEATDAETVTVTWNDQEWTVPASIDATEATVVMEWEAGHTLAFLRGVLGQAQWLRFNKGNRSKSGDAAELMKTIFRDGWGVDLGE